MLFRPIILLASALAASALKLSGKVSTTTTDGSDKSYKLDQVPHITLDQSTWKLSFTTDSIPFNQAHLLFEAPSGDVSLPVKIKSGRGSFTINPAKPPTALLASSGTFDVTLLLSTHDDAVSQSLGSISLPSTTLKPVKRKRNDLPPRQGEPAFQVQPELFHTFEPEPKEIGAFVSLVGTGLVLVPWVLFAALYAKVSPRLSGLSAYSSLFLLTLTALEGLIVIYWLKLKLYHFLPIFVPLSLVTAYTGKLAISRK